MFCNDAVCAERPARLGMRACDDQGSLNKVYEFGKVQWLDVNDTRQSEFYKSPLGYHKIGVVDRLFLDHPWENLMSELPETPKLRTLIMAERDMMRGGKPEDCRDVWILNPTTYKPTNEAKEEMFERFASCFNKTL